MSSTDKTEALGGSSPHTRGARDCCRSSQACWRIIPAYAGSTVTPFTFRDGITDHPRIRGEHAGVTDTGTLAAGSSPHTRGAHCPCPLGAHWTRIIPAYAGSTVSRRSTFSGNRDHPRIRGEHPFRVQRPSCGVGSSPHTRGAPVGHSLAASDARIIPAYAGSTSSTLLPRGCSSDHPRIRGEHHGISRLTSWNVGSSPHTRGAR